VVSVVLVCDDVITSDGKRAGICVLGGEGRWLLAQLLENVVIVDAHVFAGVCIAPCVVGGVVVL